MWRTRPAPWLARLTRQSFLPPLRNKAAGLESRPAWRYWDRSVTRGSILGSEASSHLIGWGAAQPSTHGPALQISAFRFSLTWSWLAALIEAKRSADLEQGLTRMSYTAFQ